MVMNSITNHESSEATSQLVASASIIQGLFIRFDQHFNIIRASTQCEQLLGYSNQELVGRSFCHFIHPEDAQRLTWYYNAYLKHKKEKDYFKVVYRILTKNNGYEWLESIFWVKKSNGDKILGFIGYATRALRFAKHYELIRTQTKWFQSILEDLRQPIAIVFEDLYIYANRAYVELFFDKKEYSLSGCYISNFLSKESSDWMTKKIQSIEENDQCERLITSYCGKMIDASIRFSSIDDGKCPLIKIEMEDLSEQKKVREVMLHSEKLSAVGQLAAGIAHEIRNPLTAIKGFIQLLESNSHPYLKIILDEISRIETIISELLLLSKPHNKKMKSINIFSVIQQVIDLMKPHAMMNNVYIHVKDLSSTLLLCCDQNQMKQVFLNIIKNAIEAMEKRGNIYIDILETDGSFQVVVQDEGVGIPKELIPKIKQPFFTTKEKGTGLGLMICDQIVREHGGMMDFQCLEKGTKVTITLPK